MKEILHKQLAYCQLAMRLVVEAQQHGLPAAVADLESAEDWQGLSEYIEALKPFHQ